MARAASSRPNGGGLVGAQAASRSAKVTNARWIFRRFGVITSIVAVPWNRGGLRRRYCGKPSGAWQWPRCRERSRNPKIAPPAPAQRSIEAPYGHRLFSQTDDREGRVGHVPDDRRTGKHQG